MLWNHQRAEEERRDSRGKKKKGISGAAAEHVAQSNQYFLVTAGIGLRNKPSLINHMENHSHTLTNTSLRDGTFVWHRGKRVSLYLLMWAYMFGDTDNWAFVWDLPPPSCCLLLLHHLPLLPSSPPWCCYCCDIFLSSIPEVIWLVKLHLFPRLPPPRSAPLRFPVWVAAITLALSLVRDLGGQHPLRSIVIEMTPHLSPWRQPLHSGVPHPP